MILLNTLNQKVFIQMSIGIIETVFELFQKRDVVPDSFLNRLPQVPEQDFVACFIEFTIFQCSEKLVMSPYS